MKVKGITVSEALHDYDVVGIAYNSTELVQNSNSSPIVAVFHFSRIVVRDFVVCVFTRVHYVHMYVVLD